MKNATGCDPLKQLLAKARATRVLPVPGGPQKSTPFGGDRPKRLKSSGYMRGNATISFRDAKCSSKPPT